MTLGLKVALAVLATTSLAAPQNRVGERALTSSIAGTDVGEPQPVTFACSPNPQAVSKAVFQTKTTWQNVTIWDCAIKNGTAETLTITEGHLIQAAIGAGVVPISSAHMRTFAGENMRRGVLQTTVRVLGLAAQGLAVASAGNFGVSVSETTGAMLAGLAGGFPVIGRALEKRAASPELFERMAWRDSVGLEPGQTVTVTLFSTAVHGQAPIRGGL